ncbi:hypothetical protein F5Y01DRAFT_206491 [Xylaria sp. FL0043]|nr:hypothetical protein F5Y01DRAFT_206491 [Xylaria sp. FL0043]
MRVLAKTWRPARSSKVTVPHVSHNYSAPSVLTFYRDNELNVALHRSEDLVHEDSSHSSQICQIYVHPQFIHVYRVPIVDHSTACHDCRMTPYLACYMASVPTTEATQDTERHCLTSRQVGMARLSETGELDEASSQ